MSLVKSSTTHSLNMFIPTHKNIQRMSLVMTCGLWSLKAKTNFSKKKLKKLCVLMIIPGNNYHLQAVILTLRKSFVLFYKYYYVKLLILPYFANDFFKQNSEKWLCSLYWYMCVFNTFILCIVYFIIKLILKKMQHVIRFMLATITTFRKITISGVE